MKKFMLILCLEMFTLSLTGCGGPKNDTDSQGSESSNPSSEMVSDTQDSQTPESSGEETTGTVVNGFDYANGWTEEMAGIKSAVTDALGENYWPDTGVLPDMLESTFGVAPDMYDDYFAETPMIGTNVDTLLVVKAKEDKAQAVEEALNAYRDSKVSDTMQYPMNVGKIQASRVERIGNYVCFVQLGADTMDALDIGDEEVIRQCQEVNELVIEIISQKVQK